MTLLWFCCGIGHTEPDQQALLNPCEAPASTCSIFLLGGLFFRSGKACAAPCLSLTRNQCVSLKEGSVWPPIIGVVSRQLSRFDPILLSGSGFLNFIFWCGVKPWRLRTVHVCGGGHSFPSVYVSPVAAWERFLAVVRR